MDWNQILSDSGLSEREVSVVNVLAGKPSMKASEVAKELGVTRLDAYKALEDLQEKGMVSVIADRPMRFTCPRIDQAVEQLIEIRRRQLNRIESSFEEIQSSVESSNFEFQEVEAEDNPKFTILKERVRILGRLEKMGNDSQSDLGDDSGKIRHSTTVQECYHYFHQRCCKERSQGSGPGSIGQENSSILQRPSRVYRSSPFGRNGGPGCGHGSK